MTTENQEPKEEKKTKKRQFKYDKLTLEVKDMIGTKHTFVIDADKLADLHGEFAKAGVNFMGLLMNFAEEKKIILQ